MMMLVLSRRVVDESATVVYLHTDGSRHIPIITKGGEDEAPVIASAARSKDETLCIGMIWVVDLGVILVEVPSKVNLFIRMDFC